MKTLIYSVIATIIVLAACFLISLICKTRTKTDQKTTLFTLPLCILLLFISLFVGAGISRNHIKKELEVMRVENNKRYLNDDSRLKKIELRNRNISWIIGPDEEITKEIEALRNQ